MEEIWNLVGWISMELLGNAGSSAAYSRDEAVGSGLWSILCGHHVLVKTLVTNELLLVTYLVSLCRKACLEKYFKRCVASAVTFSED